MTGLHHVTAITRDVQANVDFWMGFLGLSLVKSFIELHGGRVEIESRVNEGTCIRCILPVRASASAQPADTVRAGT